MMGISPALADAPPAPAPVAQAANVAPNASLSVMILPFREIGNNAADAWISEAVDWDLKSELLKNYQVTFTPAPAKLPDSQAEAIQDGLAAGAQFVVYGTYHVVNGQVRVNGSIVSVADGRATGSVIATGDLKDLFKVEDALSAQLQLRLPLTRNKVEEAPAARPPVQVFVSPAPQTGYYPEDESPAITYAYPDSSAYAYPYGDPYYFDNGLPYGGGITIYGGGFYGGRFDHGGFPHGGFGRGMPPSHLGGGGGFHPGGFGGGGFHGGGGHR
jgi:TolB-like protein